MKYYFVGSRKCKCGVKYSYSTSGERYRFNQIPVEFNPGVRSNGRIVTEGYTYIKKDVYRTGWPICLRLKLSFRATRDTIS